MDSELDSKLKIAFLSPQIYTTQGHKSINECVLMAASLAADQVFLTPYYNLNLTTIPKIVRSKPDVVLVDFPDVPTRSVVAMLRDQLPATEFWYLAMYAQPFDGMYAADYDLYIELEPDAADYAPAEKRVVIRPLISPIRLRNASEDQLRTWESEGIGAYRGRPLKRMLVMQTGSPAEQTRLLRYAHGIVGTLNKGLVIVPSLQVMQPAVRLAPLADVLVAATGYSTSWELHTLGLLPRTHLIDLDRPLEDLARRRAAIVEQDTRVQIPEAVASGKADAMEIHTGVHDLRDLFYLASWELNTLGRLKGRHATDQGSNHAGSVKEQ